MTEERRGAGRPPFTPTPVQRDEVELMVMGGIGQRGIAAALGIDVLTLSKHFRDELDHGMARKYRQIIKMLYKAAESGNVTAQKKLLEVADRQTATAQLEKHLPVRLQPGKKEQAAADAQNAGDGTKWAGFLHEEGNEPKDLPN